MGKKWVRFGLTRQIRGQKNRFVLHAGSLWGPFLQVQYFGARFDPSLGPVPARGTGEGGGQQPSNHSKSLQFLFVLEAAEPRRDFPCLHTTGHQRANSTVSPYSSQW